jgi:hypothetical protein
MEGSTETAASGFSGVESDTGSISKTKDWQMSKRYEDITNGPLQDGRDPRL